MIPKKNQDNQDHSNTPFAKVFQHEKPLQIQQSKFDFSTIKSDLYGQLYKEKATKDLSFYMLLKAIKSKISGQLNSLRLYNLYAEEKKKAVQLHNETLAQLTNQCESTFTQYRTAMLNSYEESTAALKYEEAKHRLINKIQEVNGYYLNHFPFYVLNSHIYEMALNPLAWEAMSLHTQYLSKPENEKALLEKFEQRLTEHKTQHNFAFQTMKNQLSVSSTPTSMVWSNELACIKQGQAFLFYSSLSENVRAQHEALFQTISSVRDSYSSWTDGRIVESYTFEGGNRRPEGNLANTLIMFFNDHMKKIHKKMAKLVEFKNPLSLHQDPNCIDQWSYRPEMITSLNHEELNDLRIDRLIQMHMIIVHLIDQIKFLNPKRNPNVLNPGSKVKLKHLGSGSPIIISPSKEEKIGKLSKSLSLGRKQGKLVASDLTISLKQSPNILDDTSKLIRLKSNLFTSLNSFARLLNFFMQFETGHRLICKEERPDNSEWLNTLLVTNKIIESINHQLPDEQDLNELLPKLYK